MEKKMTFTRIPVTPETVLYRHGSPFRTPAVVQNLSRDGVKDEDLPGFRAREESGQLILEYTMGDQDRVFGLGQHVGALNKRGQVYRMFATDHSPRQPDSEVVYGSHPFLMVLGVKNWGLFVDYPGEITFDVGFTRHDLLEIRLASVHADFYLFQVEDEQEISPALFLVREYLRLTGAPYVPPRWAFGYHQSRYGYRNEADVRRIAGQFRALDLPCDAIYLDIDYMDDYKVFTVDPSRFPDMKKLSSDLRSEGFELVPIIDAAVKAEKGYPVDDQARQRGYLCQDKNGNDFVCGVWPGPSHLPDFLKPETRQWWGDWYRFFFDLGIRGFWNDMNEPAIFYTEKALKKVAKKVNQVFRGSKKAMEFIETLGELGSLCHRREYYGQFYQKAEPEVRVNHQEVHNLYGLTMVQAASEGFSRHLPDHRPFLISRSSAPGLHRIAGVWTGDNYSWWEHLRLHIRHLISLGFMGFFYTGADIGGFGSNPSAELLVRWMQLGVFSPLFRNHTWYAARDQEPWSFGDRFTAILRNTLKIRYALLPFLYSEYHLAVRALKPLIRPLFTDFPRDERVYGVEDQFLFGSSLLVAPVCEPNARGRTVYLPEGRWLHWSLDHYQNRKMEVFEGGDHFVGAELGSTPVFLRENSLIVLTEPGTSSAKTTAVQLKILGFVTDRAELDFYEDSGDGAGFQDGDFSVTRILVTKVKDDLQTHAQQVQGKRPSEIQEISIEIYDSHGHRFSKTLN